MSNCTTTPSTPRPVHTHRECSGMRAYSGLYATRSPARMATRPPKRSTRVRRGSDAAPLPTHLRQWVRPFPPSHEIIPTLSLGWITCTTRALRPLATAPLTGHPSPGRRTGLSSRSSKRAYVMTPRHARHSGSTGAARTVRTFRTSSRRLTTRRSSTQERRCARYA